MSKAAYYIYMHLISIILVLAGAINWLIVGGFQYNLVSGIFGKYSYVIYILVGLAGLRLAFQRDTYLPYLGWNVLPSSLIEEKIQGDADLHIKIDAPKHAVKVIYWASEKSDKDNLNYVSAYQNFNNSGVSLVKDNQAIVHLKCPSKYNVFYKQLPKHFHYRFVMDSGFISDIRTKQIEC